MPASHASVFGEVEDFQTALSAEVLLTARGQFRARLTQVVLNRLRLADIDEALPRIASVAVPAGMVLVSFPIGGGPSQVWGGIEIRIGEMITLGPGQRLHARTVGRCHWGAIQVPNRQFADYGRVMSGAGFNVPPVARWRPPLAAVRQLRHLHRAGIRMAEARAEKLIDVQAVHGLEQQLFHALIECLAEGAEEETPAARRHRGIVARFEDLLLAEPFLLMADICAALGVSDGCCQVKGFRARAVNASCGLTLRRLRFATAGSPRLGRSGALIVRRDGVEG
jgi:hypothetical protein